LAVTRKTAVKNTNTSSAKAVAYGHSGDSTIIEATSAKSEDDDDDNDDDNDDDDDDDFEATLAVLDPHGEARLDFSSSIAYYNSRVYKACAGKPKSKWTQEAYLPASRHGMIMLKAPMKRRFGVLGEVTRTKDGCSKNLTRMRNVPPKCNKQVTSKQQTRSFLTSIN
jgi:hypothetical protein